MTEFIRFSSRFEHTDRKSGQRTRYPAGWAGEVSPEVAKAARKAGAVPPEAEPRRGEPGSQTGDDGAPGPNA